MKSVFCVHCGKKNKVNDKICTKCKKKLNPKEKFLRIGVMKCMVKSQVMVCHIIKVIQKNSIRKTIN